MLQQPFDLGYQNPIFINHLKINPRQKDRWTRLSKRMMNQQKTSHERDLDYNHKKQWGKEATEEFLNNQKSWRDWAKPKKRTSLLQHGRISSIIFLSKNNASVVRFSIVHIVASIAGLETASPELRQSTTSDILFWFSRLLLPHPPPRAGFHPGDHASCPLLSWTACWMSPVPASCHGH